MKPNSGPFIPDGWTLREYLDRVYAEWYAADLLIRLMANHGLKHEDFRDIFALQIPGHVRLEHLAIMEAAHQMVSASHYFDERELVRKLEELADDLMREQR